MLGVGHRTEHALVPRGHHWIPIVVAHVTHPFGAHLIGSHPVAAAVDCEATISTGNKLVRERFVVGAHGTR